MLSEEIVARNVLTIIERLSTKLSVPLRNFYSALSQYAHPNYHGMMASYTEFGMEGAIKIFTERRTGGQHALIITAIGAIATSASIVIDSFEILAAELQGLAVLAERAIFEQRKWPADVEYPVRRS